MTAITARPPAQMVAEADEILRKVREVSWPEGGHAQKAIAYDYAYATEVRGVYDALVNEEMDPLKVDAPDVGWWDDPQRCALEYAADQYLEAAKSLRNRVAEFKRHEGRVS
jgi:hypothetical protein